MKKKIFLAPALVLAMAVAAEAQIRIEYSRHSGRRSYGLSFTGGYGYGYGYGYSSGCGVYGFGGYATSGFGPGFVGHVGGGALRFGVRHVLPGLDYAGRGAYGAMPYGYVEGRGVTYYSGPAYGYPGYGGYGAVPPMPDVNPPTRRPRGVSDRAHEFVAGKEIEDGRRLFARGDVRGAVDKFRDAVIADTLSGTAQAYFAVGLAAQGKFAAADKALRSAARHRPIEKPELTFHPRVLKRLAEKSGASVLVRAYVDFLQSKPDALKALAAKDGAAKELLGE